MSRELVWDPNAVCEDCGHKGAYDIPWEAPLCDECMDRYIHAAEQELDEDWDVSVGDFYDEY